MQLFQRLNATAGDVRCPVYVQWASEEKITCRAAAEAFVAQLSDHEVAWDEVRDARHVMIHGRRGPGLVRAIRDWLLAHLDDATPRAASTASDASESRTESSADSQEADVSRPVSPASDEAAGTGESGGIGARVAAMLWGKAGQAEGDAAGWPAGKAGSTAVERMPVQRCIEEGVGGGHLLSVTSAVCISDRSSDGGGSGRLSAALPAHMTIDAPISS